MAIGWNIKHLCDILVKERKTMEQIPIKMLRPHPDNPRKDLGDLSELAESIKNRGVMQNLTVIPHYELCKIAYYTILIGHRRCAAAKLAGLKTLPCTVVTRMSKKEQIATMLLENMQRSDLTPLEQAEGFQLMIDLGEGLKDIEKKTGFSSTTIWHRIKLLELDKEELRKAQEREVKITDYAKLEKLKSQEDKNECLKVIGTNNFDYTYKNKLHQQETKEQQKVAKEHLERKGLIDISQEEMKYLSYDTIITGYYSRCADQIEKCIANNNDIQLYFSFSTVSDDWIAIYKKTSRAVEDNAEERQKARDEQKKIKEEERRRTEDIQQRKMILSNIRDIARKTVDEFVDKYTGNKDDEHLLFDYLVKLETEYYLSISANRTGEITNHQKDYNYKTDKNICRKLMLFIRATIRHNDRYDDDIDNFLDLYEDRVEYYADDNAYLEFIELLEGFGYQVADEERSYYNGTHKAFSKNDED